MAGCRVFGGPAVAAHERVAGEPAERGDPEGTVLCDNPQGGAAAGQLRRPGQDSR